MTMTIDEFTAFLSAETGIELTDPQAPFTDQGIDSFGYLGVLVAVEDRYSIEIDPTSFTEGLPRTPAELHDFAEHAASARTE